MERGRVPRDHRGVPRPARARRVAGVVPEQPRPPARGDALRRPRGAGRGDAAGDAARYAVPVPGRGARARRRAGRARRGSSTSTGAIPSAAPIPWEPPSRAGAGAGFTTGEPWLPIDPDAEQVNAADAGATIPRSVLSLYRALLALRRAEPDLQGGGSALPRRRRRRRPRLRARRRHLVALNFAPAPRRDRPAWARRAWS